MAFEVTKRRRRRDFVHFVELFSTSRTQERSEVDSNSRFCLFSVKTANFLYFPFFGGPKEVSVGKGNRTIAA